MAELFARGGARETPFALPFKTIQRRPAAWVFLADCHAIAAIARWAVALDRQLVPDRARLAPERPSDRRAATGIRTPNGTNASITPDPGGILLDLHV
jgi:hypothetical protein